ncbi:MULTISPECIES: arginine ABC transporter permease ArtM [unclassified Vibrio]|uniref:Arginine ABC transporter permease protein ArtM n=1 Tax=Vibrio sp. HB236076 TaxID=3232307 RepID=A0AB39HKU0_9VIBR|nr:arginine ABC transporter permease ArtM [Vibrio sp. HB161653]MDP5253203.1 arginine ABC transporter permease ArtM [Vibrio sp. HB161653]
MFNPTYLSPLFDGLYTSLGLTAAALAVGGVIAITMTIVFSLKLAYLTPLLRGFIVLFTGTPLLVQIFLIYYGPGQFDWIKSSVFWHWLREPWFCAMLALALNTAAYSSQLFYGAVKAIPQGQWQACYALGMNKQQTLRVVLPYALKRAIPAYSNEVILVFKGTSLASTITIMDVMGYAQRLNAQTYDTLVIFSMAGVFYLLVNGGLTLLFRGLEKRLLQFEASR